MSQGLPPPYPFPQPVGPPPGYTTIKTYPVLYGQTVYLLADLKYYVVGSRLVFEAPGPRAPGASTREPADGYQILDSRGRVPTDAHQRPLPVKYGDEIQLRNTQTGDFWWVDGGVLLGTKSRGRKANFRISSPQIPDGTGLSSYVANTFPYGYPQVNQFALEIDGEKVRQARNAMILDAHGSRLSFVLAYTPTISSGGRASRDLITSVTPPGRPGFFIAPFQPRSLSQILPSTMSYQYPSSRVYDGPYPPPYGPLVPKGYY